MIRNVAALALLLVWRFPLVAQGQPLSETSPPPTDLGVFAGEPSGLRFDPISHIGPDATGLRYGYIGRWEAATGGEFALVGVQGVSGALAVAFGGLLELSNDGDDAPVPFQLLRAVVGLSLVGSSRPFELSDARGQLFARLGLFHESDHFSGRSFTRTDFESAWAGPVDDFSSFEYLRLEGHYLHRIADEWTLSGSLGLRLFTPPINQFAKRAQTLGVDLEFQAERHLTRVASVYVGTYWEGTHNDLDPSLLPTLTFPSFAEALRIEAGFRFRGELFGNLDVFVGGMSMDGRGLDFANSYPFRFLFGVRGSL